MLETGITVEVGLIIGGEYKGSNSPRPQVAQRKRGGEEPAEGGEGGPPCARTARYLRKRPVSGVIAGCRKLSFGVRGQGPMQCNVLRLDWS